MSQNKRRVVLVRHGESTWNAQGRWQGHEGSGLSERGRAQAEVTARHLGLVATDTVAIVHSDLQRVVETMGPALEHFDVPVTEDRTWREIDVGSWAGLTRDEVATHDPTGFAAWQRGEDPARGGGETDAELRARVAAALAPLADGEGTVLVFSHGGPVRHAAAEALALPDGGHRRLGGVRNCAVTTLEPRQDGWALVSYNAVAHLGDLVGPAHGAVPGATKGRVFDAAPPR